MHDSMRQRCMHAYKTHSTPDCSIKLNNPCCDDFHLALLLVVFVEARPLSLRRPSF